jgi:hypothetical protein
MSWAGHVARKGAKRNTYRLLVGEPEVDYLEELGVNWRLILK